MTKLLDCNGIDFAAVRGLLPAGPTRDWPNPKRVQKSARDKWLMISALHADPDWQFCWACGYRGNYGVLIQIHHLGHGSRRSDEKTCLIPLCYPLGGRGCHENVAGNFAKLLWARWRWGRDSLSWERVARCEGCHLPTPEAPDNGEFFPAGFGQTKARSA